MSTQDHAALELASVVASMRDRVPCIATGAADQWFAEQLDEYDVAIRACRTCPALAACRSYVTRWPEPFGIWAMTTPRDRGFKMPRSRKDDAA